MDLPHVGADITAGSVPVFMAVLNQQLAVICAGCGDLSSRF
jgi:hypothetical protein